MFIILSSLSFYPSIFIFLSFYLHISILPSLSFYPSIFIFLSFHLYLYILLSLYFYPSIFIFLSFYLHISILTFLSFYPSIWYSSNPSNFTKLFPTLHPLFRGTTNKPQTNQGQNYFNITGGIIHFKAFKNVASEVNNIVFFFVV